MAGRPASRVRGLSEAQFRAACGTGEQCRAVVGKPRRPGGFVRPPCGGTEGKRPGTRPKLRCRACRRRVSPTAGTVFHATKPPLTTWFPAVWLVATAENGTGSVEPGRRLGTRQTDARALKRKIMAVMAGREGQKRPDGRVETGDAYPGGHRQAGPRRRRQAALRGRGLDRRRPRKIKLLPVKGFRKEEVSRLVAEHPASTARPATDGLGCRTAAAEAGPGHAAMVTGGGRAARRSPFKRVDTTPGNVEAAITGAYRRVGPEHAGRHLAGFARRHDRRFQRESPIPRLAHGAVRAAPLPYAMLVAGRPSGLLRIGIGSAESPPGSPAGLYKPFHIVPSFLPAQPAT